MIISLKQLCYRHFEEQMPITPEGCSPETTARFSAFAARIRELGGEVLRDLGPNLTARLLRCPNFPDHLFRYMSDTTVLDLKHHKIASMTLMHLLKILRIMFATVRPADNPLTYISLNRQTDFESPAMDQILQLCPHLRQLSIDSSIKDLEQGLVQFSAQHPSLTLHFKVESGFGEDENQEASSSKLLKKLEWLKTIQSPHHIVWEINPSLFDTPSSVDDISELLRIFPKIYKLAFVGDVSPANIAKIHELFLRHKNRIFEFSLTGEHSIGKFLEITSINSPGTPFHKRSHLNVLDLYQNMPPAPLIELLPFLNIRKLGIPYRHLTPSIVQQLKSVSITQDTNLRHLYMPSLTGSISIYSAPNLTSVYAPNARSLKLYSCGSLTEVHAPNANSFVINCNNILTSLSFPVATGSIVVFGARNLTELHAPYARHLGLMKVGLTELIHNGESISISDSHHLKVINLPNATSGIFSNNPVLETVHAPVMTEGRCEFSAAIAEVNLPLFTQDLTIPSTLFLRYVNAPKARILIPSVHSPQVVTNVSWRARWIKLLLFVLTTLEVFLITYIVLNRPGLSTKDLINDNGAKTPLL